MAFVKAAAVSDVPQGTGKQISIGGRELALFHVAGGFYALDNTCPHRGAPLAEGTCSGMEVICPWHGARFRLTDGTHLCPPAARGVAVYPVQVVGDEVQIDV